MPKGGVTKGLTYSILICLLVEVAAEICEPSLSMWHCFCKNAARGFCLSWGVLYLIKMPLPLALRSDDTQPNWLSYGELLTNTVPCGVFLTVSNSDDWLEILRNHTEIMTVEGGGLGVARFGWNSMKICICSSIIRYDMHFLYIGTYGQIL